VVMVVPPPQKHRGAQHSRKVGELDIALQPAEGLAPKYSPTTAQLVGALASHTENRTTNARSMPLPWPG